MIEITATEIKVLVRESDTAYLIIGEHENGLAAVQLRLTVGGTTADSPSVACADLEEARGYVGAMTDSMLRNGWSAV
jgi:hypothetical protein